MSACVCCVPGGVGGRGGPEATQVPQATVILGQVGRGLRSPVTVTGKRPEFRRLRPGFALLFLFVEIACCFVLLACALLCLFVFIFFLLVLPLHACMFWPCAREVSRPVSSYTSRARPPLTLLEWTSRSRHHVCSCCKSFISRAEFCFSFLARCFAWFATAIFAQPSLVLFSTLSTSPVAW